MESIDRRAMCKYLYPHMLRASQTGTLDAQQLDAAIAACAEGYSFPTNLDRDPPVGGLAPETQQDLFRRAVTTGMAPTDFAARIHKGFANQQA